MKFATRPFQFQEVTQIDRWINSFLDGQHGVTIAGMTSFVYGGMSYVVISLKIWNRSEASATAIAVRATIDEIPQEPTIQYPEGDLPNEDPI